VSDAPELSLVVPLRDEEENVDALVDEIATVLGAAVPGYELILVDDGSTDGTWARIQRLHAAGRSLVALRFARGFGQSAAFTAGFAAARAPLVATMDGDLQNDPADLPGLMRLAATHDIVCGWRRDRQDAVLTRHVPSVVANALIALVTGIRLHDNGCSLKVFRARVVKPLFLRPGMHRYLPAIASQLGGRVTEVVVHHRARRFGHSKYGLSRTFRVVVDLLHLHRLMREALVPPPAGEPLYEVAERLGDSGVEQSGTAALLH
jgi:glycosyltransferase involved in cell wall biosynthesis